MKDDRQVPAPDYNYKIQNTNNAYQSSIKVKEVNIISMHKRDIQYW